jgi:hypothetical protein
MAKRLGCFLKGLVPKDAGLALKKPETLNSRWIQIA